MRGPLAMGFSLEEGSTTELKRRVALTDSALQVPYLVALAAGFALGLATGRWWVMIAAAFPAGWIAGVQEVDAPGWVLPVAFGTMTVLGIAAGVATRKAIRRPHSRAQS